MASDSDHYAKKITAIKKAQSDDSAALHLIDTYKAISKEVDKSALSLNEAKDKLTALQAKETSAANAKKALNTELNKQIERLAKLKTHSEAAGGSNKKLNKLILDQSRALKTLRAEAAAANRPNAILTNQLAKQAEKVASLTRVSGDHNQRLTQVGKGMKKAGIDASKLDDEFARLSTNYNSHAAKIDKVSKRYKKLQTIMMPFQKMNKVITLPSLKTAKRGGMVGGAVLGSMVGFGAIIADTAEQVNELSRAAKDVAMPVDALQAMRMQAKGAGAEAEDMDAAIKEMNLRWGEMKTLKSGAMNDYFKDTGNGQAYKDLMNAKNSMEAYQVLLREIAKETDASKQNFMADEFFGGDSEKMLSVLKAGTDGLNKAKQELNDTGGPISSESVEAAAKFGSTLKTLSAIVDSLKISALTPIMEELSIIFGEFAENMKNMEWREDAIEKLRKTVSGVFTAFKALGSGVLFLSENFRGMLATLAVLKVAFIVLNAIMLGNPISLMVVGIAAAVIAIGYLIDKFIGFDVILKAIGAYYSFLWEGLKKLINLLPDSIVPDWAKPAKEAGDEIDNLAGKVKNVKDKNIELGITTNETLNKNTNSKRTGTTQKDSSVISGQKITPLTTYTVKSQAEVALTIKSEKPITVDKVNSDNGTNLSVDVGNMMMSY
ncbi:hypothetical protein A6E04_19205 [Aliivibrio logei]|uniref:Phage tail tape measure protein n=2 Tax=Aliivibrio logei TaxID=688 RepID=A0A1B9NU21_ALILO|nr:hypothetical protein A6E04_19205 [Aliivibrio logei]